MQSSTESCRSSTMIDTELEDGEIGDDEDDGTGIQSELSEAGGSTPAGIIPIASSGILNCSMSFSSSISSPMRTTPSQSGFWAKLKPSLPSGRQTNFYYSSIGAKSSRNSPVFVENDQRTSFTMNSDFGKNTSKCLPLSLILEPRRLNRRDVENITKQHCQVGNVAENNIVLEELEELELRLEALQSTMKRADEKVPSGSPSEMKHCGIEQRYERKMLPNGRRSEENDCKTVGRSLDSFGKMSKRRKRSRKSRRASKTTVPQPSGRNYSRKISLISEKMGSLRVEMSDEESRHQSPSQDGNHHLQRERARILNMNDPNEQVRAFLNLLTRPRSETAGSPRPDGNLASDTNATMDSHEDDRVDTSNEPEKDVPKSPLSVLLSPKSGGFWGRPVSRKNQNDTLCIPGKDLGARMTDKDVQSCQSSSSKHATNSDPVTVNEDPNEEEMEALRELALSSMLRAKAKKEKQTLDPQPKVDAESRNEGNSTSSGDAVPEINPSTLYQNTVIKEPPSEESTEVVITLNEDVLKNLQRAHQRTSQQLSGQTHDSEGRSGFERQNFGLQKTSPKTDRRGKSANASPANGVETKGSSPFPVGNSEDEIRKRIMDSVAEEKAVNSTPAAASTSASNSMEKNAPKLELKHRKMPPASTSSEFVKMIHKPLIIPLDDSGSSDEEELDNAGTGAAFQIQKPLAKSSSSSRLHSTKSNTTADKDNNAMNVNGEVQRQSNTEKHCPDAGVGPVSLVRQLEDRLRVCVDDLGRHQNCLNEDYKRLRTLESIVRRHKIDLKLAEMRKHKLKKELLHVEAQNSSYKVSIAKFNAEIQKVQQRVDKNVDLQQLYLRQWKEIEQLVSKHKLNVTIKVPQASTTLQTDLIVPSVTVPSPKPVRTKRKSKDYKTSKKARTTSPAKPETESVASSSQRTVDDSLEQFEPDTMDTCANPLRWFKSYRLSPCFQSLGQYKLDSTSFANKLNPMVPLCPFALAGVCLDTGCVWQHEKDYCFNDTEMVADLLSYRPEVVAEGANEKTIRTFAEELLCSLRGVKSVNDVLGYCLTKMESSAQLGGPKLGVDVGGRQWIIRQRSDRYNPQSSALKEASISSNTSVQEVSPLEIASTGIRYFSACSAGGEVDQPSCSSMGEGSEISQQQ